MKNKSEWFCRRCGQRVILYVRPSEPPKHLCQKRLNRDLPLELKGKEEQ